MLANVLEFPDRRTAAFARHLPLGTTAMAGWLAGALDEIDYGVVVLAPSTAVVHANRSARHALDPTQPLQLRDGRLEADRPEDARALAALLAAVLQRRQHRFATFGAAPNRLAAAAVPLTPDGAADPEGVLLMLGKRRVCEALSVDAYARSHGLTLAEARVLERLASGEAPCQAAQVLGVAISTVRTQIGQIRQKTGARSIRALLREIATLPPLMGVRAMRSA